MKNLTLIIAITFHVSLFAIHTFSQPCLPEGIEFNTQEEIDNFQINYPGCNEIEGNVYIGTYPPNTDITNLNGLNILTNIGGNLKIILNESLTSLVGLDNVGSIGGDLEMWENPGLTSLAGLNNLTTIGGFLRVSEHTELISLTGLENVTSIGGDLIIVENVILENLSGFENVSFIGGDLWIVGNHSLSSCDAQCLCDYLYSPEGIINIYNNAPGCNNPGEIATTCGFTMPCLPYGNYHFSNQSEVDSFQTHYPGCTLLEGNVFIEGEDISNLNGLSEVTHISGDLSIYNNYSLTSLTGLEGLNTIDGNLTIGFYYGNGNHYLTSLTGLNNLTSIGGNLSIGQETFTNLQGLEGLTSIGGNLNIGDIDEGGNNNLINLSGLESLTSIEGNLNIYFNDALTNLMGLESLTYIGGEIWIEENDSLTTLEGLEGLTIIENSLYLEFNTSLTSLTGLEKLESVGGDFLLQSNNTLTDISSLTNLTSLGGAISIKYNHALTTLSGLNNIEAATISDLIISDNSQLSTCEVQSICDYLANPNGIINIDDNAPGCNNSDEVIDACDGVSVEELYIEVSFTISPNPIKSTVLVEYTLQQDSPITIQILDISGQVVETPFDEFQQQGIQKVIFDGTGLNPGIYFCVLKANPAGAGQTLKMIKY